VAGSPSSGTGVGVGVAVNVGSVTTHATIGEGALVTAKGVSLDASMRKVGEDKVDTLDAEASSGGAAARPV